MRAGDTARRDALRLLRAALKNAEIDRRGGDAASPMQESDVRAVIQRQIKQRRDSIEQFRKGGREDLAIKEEAELAVFQAYLPQGASEAEMRAAVEAVIAETGAQGPKDMGKVMPAALGPRRRPTPTAARSRTSSGNFSPAKAARGAFRCRRRRTRR